MKYLYFLMIVLIALIFGCKIKSENIENKVKQTSIPHTKYNDSLHLDTMYVINNKVYFHLQNYWLDTNKLIFKDILFSNGIDLLKNTSIVTIDINKTININTVDLHFASDSLIINQFMKMLKIIDVSRGKIIYSDITESEYDELKFYINYFFNFTNKNEFHGTDTIKYNYIVLGQKNEIPLLAKLDLKITGNDKLNKLKIKYKKNISDDYVVHQYESVNKYCKNIIFKLQLITYNPEYYDRSDYVPMYNKLRFYKFSDER